MRMKKKKKWLLSWNLPILRKQPKQRLHYPRLNNNKRSRHLRLRRSKLLSNLLKRVMRRTTERSLRMMLMISWPTMSMMKRTKKTMMKKRLTWEALWLNRKERHHKTVKAATKACSQFRRNKTQDRTSKTSRDRVKESLNNNNNKRERTLTKVRLIVN